MLLNCLGLSKFLLFAAGFSLCNGQLPFQRSKFFGDSNCVTLFAFAASSSSIGLATRLFRRHTSIVDTGLVQLPDVAVDNLGDTMGISVVVEAYDPRLDVVTGIEVRVGGEFLTFCVFRKVNRRATWTVNGGGKLELLKFLFARVDLPGRVSNLVQNQSGRCHSVLTNGKRTFEFKRDHGTIYLDSRHACVVIQQGRVGATGNGPFNDEFRSVVNCGVKIVIPKSESKADRCAGRITGKSNRRQPGALGVDI